MTSKEVAEMLHVSKSFLLQLDTAGTLPAIRIGKLSKTGGHRRWKYSDVKHYMNGETV